MATEAEFLRAIDAQPADETLRLVYADWLDEQGDARAAGVRTRCAEITHLTDKLQCLREADTAYELPYANTHYYGLGDPLPTADVVAYEERHGIQLPSDYRDFLLRIGGGGVGPGIGFMPLPDIGPLYRPKEPFVPNDDPLWRAFHGTLPYVTLGEWPMYPIVIVVSGPLRGEVWENEERRGYRRAASSFFAWYETWLNDLLGQYEVAQAPAELEAMAKSGPDGLRAVLKRTDDPNHMIGNIAWRTLSAQGDRAAVLVPELVALMRESRDSRRDAAAFALQRLGRAAVAAVPLLVTLLPGANRNIHVEVISTLVAVGGGEQAVSAILGRIADPFESDRERCRWITVLGMLKEYARPAISVLDVLVKTDQPPHRPVSRLVREGEVSRFARKALSDIDTDRRTESRRCPAFHPDSVRENDYIRGFEG